ncbi:hypothetical protein FCI23_46300 [Actinacidiphila oryziradicis]|uniref:Uncharacterized protein n=1 Tax=Actinacidiphila oryziradicis TaxID=2571141 RepID=A0A4U0RT72_9ACTN|nr:hypothetical protein FCI23_46300 [Actinacidiphila oryziradicis]
MFLETETSGSTQSLPCRAARAGTRWAARAGTRCLRPAPAGPAGPGRRRRGRIYLTAPVVGALAAVAAAYILRGPGGGPSGSHCCALLWAAVSLGRGLGSGGPGF